METIDLTANSLVASGFIVESTESVSNYHNVEGELEWAKQFRGHFPKMKSNWRCTTTGDLSFTYP